MKYVLPGGSGHVGTLLANALHGNGTEVVVLSRSPRADTPWRVVTWDGATLGDWAREVDGADVVVNLAGRSVNCRYGARNREEILRSRVDSTRVVGEAIALARRPPQAWLQMSTATIYAHRFDAANDEDTGILGGNELGVPETWRFSIDVATAWERAVDEAVTPGTRKVKLRTAIVMDVGRGGPLQALLGVLRMGLGGRCGDGHQWVSWITGRDFVRALKFLVSRGDIAGAVNVASPNPLPNADFMRALCKAWGAPLALPAPRWMLELGAVFMRTETELILKSRRVVPARLLREGFTFAQPDWPAAARDLWTEWRAARQHHAS